MDEITPGFAGRDKKQGAFSRGKGSLFFAVCGQREGGECLQAIFLATTTKRPFSVWLEQVERVSRASP